MRTESLTNLAPAPSKVQRGVPHEKSPCPFGQSADATDQVHAGPKHRGEGRTGVNYGNSRTEGFVYDAVGNRTSSTDSAVGSTTYTANNLNQYTAVGADSVTYDSKGNLTQQGSGTAYAYDSKNRLLSATGTGLAFSQTYDCSNKVVGRTLNGTTTYMVYDGWSLIAEYDSSGTLLRKFVHGVVIDEILVKTEGGADAFYHHDALGSTVLLTDNTGTVQRAYEYDAFGKLSVSAAGVGIQSTGTFANRFLYTGREWLEETGLYDYRNRVYSATLGRFLQTDPIRFEAGDGNVYRYLGNVVTVWTDPEGLFTNNPQTGFGTAIPQAQALIQSLLNAIHESACCAGAAALATVMGELQSALAEAGLDHGTRGTGYRGTVDRLLNSGPGRIAQRAFEIYSAISAANSVLSTFRDCMKRPKKFGCDA